MLKKRFYQCVKKLTDWQFYKGKGVKMARKGVDLDILANSNVAKEIKSGADLVERGDVQAQMEKQEKVQTESFKNSRVERLKLKKQFRSFSVILSEDDYINFLTYLDENNIKSGSELIRSLLREKGII